MARKTFEEAASEVAEKFSERGITLVEYEGTAKPCVINCPRHGNFRVSRYQQLFQSQSGGCKDCAKELTSAALESSRQAAQDVWNAYRMTKSVAGSNNIILNDVQGDTTINNHHTHTHNHSDADGKALSMRLTPRPLLSDRQAAAFARTGKLTGSFDLFASVVAPSQYTFAVAMPDTSMSPVIEKGDLLVVEPRMCPADEDIALIELSDKRLVVAHLVIDIAGRMLIYQTGRPSEAFDLPEGSTILGVVLEVKKRFMSAAQARRRVDSDYHPWCVDGWYDFRFQNVVYAPDRSPEISRMLSSILAGYAWDTENPFVAKSEQRLSALSEWVGQLETEYSELNLNRYSVASP